MADAEEKPTHRCPMCGGTSEVQESRGGVFTRRTVHMPCPTCTPFGPFGLVPEVVAIEAALIAEVSETEKAMRAANQRSRATIAWLLADTPAPCDHCDGSGFWTHPHNPKDKRTCFKCNGKGVFV